MNNKIITNLCIGLIALAGCDKSGNDNKQQYLLNSNSIIEWKGSTPTTFNNGSFDIAANNITVSNGVVTEGTFIFPIASVKNFNLPDTLKEQFLHHLKTADFFNLAMYPDAAFSISKVQPYTDGIPGAVANANYLIEGRFMMLGKTNVISFPARISITGTTLEVEAKCTIDRTKWGMNFATDPAAPLYIYKEVELHFKLNGQRS